MDELLEIMDAQLAGGGEELDMEEERENRGDQPEAIEDVEDQEREEGEERRGGRHERGAARGRGTASDCGAGEGQSWVCAQYVDVKETCLTRTVMCIHSIMFYTRSLF